MPDPVVTDPVVPAVPAVPAEPAEPATPATPAIPAEPANSATPPVDDGTYPTNFGADKKVIHTTVVHGQRIGLSAEDIDQSVAMAVKAAQDSDARDVEAAKAEPAVKPVEEKTSAEIALEKRIEELDLKMNTAEARQSIKDRGRVIAENLDSELQNHQVFVDHPKLASLAKTQAAALLSANARTGMTEKQAVEQVAAEQGAAMNQAREDYIKGKITDAKSSEAQPGGGTIASPAPPKLTGKDLMRGKVRERAAQRLREAKVT